MWRNRNPVTGQARVTGTTDRPGLSASFNDSDGKPLVFQLNGGRAWKTAMTSLGFYDALERAGLGDLGVTIKEFRQATSESKEGDMQGVYQQVSQSEQAAARAQTSTEARR
jgi:hypothetical protein